MKIKRQEVSAALLGIAVALILWLTILGREAQIKGFLFWAGCVALPVLLFLEILRTFILK